MNRLIEYLRQHLMIDFQGDLTVAKVRELLAGDETRDAKQLLAKLVAEKSVEDFFTPAAEDARVETDPGRYTWWLDVETMNTWQSGSAEGLARNRATLEGMSDYLEELGADVGIYSTSFQLIQIVGPVPEDSPLAGRPSWLAGATTLREALANCTKRPLLPGGEVALTQYVQGDWDRNHSCD